MKRAFVPGFPRAAAHASLVFALAACGAHAFPAPTVQIAPAEGTSGPEIDALATRFYSAEVDPTAMGAEVESLLERHPRDATLHEMAALLAELREDDEAAWRHWLLAAADLRTPFAALYLDQALDSDLTGAQTSASVALLRRMLEAHPDPALRVDVARRLVRLLETREELEEATRVGAGHGFIDSWQLIGAFDNDQGRGFLAEHPPEQGIDLDAEHRGLLAPVAWRSTVVQDRAGMVRVGEQISPGQWAVAYLLTHVHSESARDVQLRVTSESGTRVWLNENTVVDQERLARANTDNLVAPVHLVAGWNRLLIKTAHGDRGEWILGARFTRLDGVPAEGLRYDTALHDLPEVPVESTPANISSLEEAIAAVEPPLRRALLVHHDATRNGYEGDALASARALLGLAPHHPVVLRHAAITHWTNGELGQAMDLLNEGVRLFPESAGFYWHRGAFYRERDRYDRAIEDLTRAIELTPGARLATMELAGTFTDRQWREHECRVLASVVERWPTSGWGLRAHGFCLQMRGYSSEARRLYERADELEPGHSWNLERLALLARGRHDEGAEIGYVTRMRALAPWSGRARVTTGDHLRYVGRRDEARAAYESARTQDPVWATPHSRLGLMAFEDGDRLDAITHWAAALERDPDNGALADRVDFLRGDEDDPDQQLMPDDAAIDRALAMEVEVDPGAHTVLLLDDEVTTVQQDGSARHRVTQVTRAFTTDGRDELIQNRVPSSARILRAFSVDTEGARQEASSIRGGVIRFRGLGVGSRVVLQYVYHAAAPAFLPNHYVGSWIFQGLHRQLGDARWVLQVPRGRGLAMNIQGAVEHALTQEGEYDVHTFTGSGVPPLVSEPQMPPAGDLLARVTVSTLTEWREYVEWERALLSEVFESNEELRGVAQRLTAGVEGTRARIDRIYRHVSQEIRYQQDYEDTIAGVRPHSCPVVLERGYGDCKDKAVLMILLARELGIDIRFVVLRTTGAGRVQRDVPNQQFNHAIVYVPQQEGIEEGFFMDPTTDGLDMGNLRPDDQGATALVLDPDDGEWAFHEIPYQSAEMTYFRCDVDVSIATAESATAQADCRTRGALASVFRRVMRNEERAGQVRQNLAHSIFQGSTVTDASSEYVEDIDHPLELRLTLDASAALQPQGEDRRMRVPSPFALGRLTRLERRRTPLRLGVHDSARWEVSFEAPPRGRIVRTPPDFTIEHECFRVSRRSVTRGRRATVTIDYARTCAEISPEQYPEFRRQAQRAATQLQDDVVFRPGS